MITVPKTAAGKSLLVLAIIAVAALAICNLSAPNIFEFVMGGFRYSSEKQADEKIMKLQEAVDIQYGVGVARVSKEGFWTETPRRSEFGWSNGLVSCHGDDRLQQNKIQCTCSK